MKKHTILSGDTLASIVLKHNIKSNDHLRLYHNLNCPEEDIMKGELIVGKTILIPDDEEFVEDSTEEFEENSDTIDDSTNSSLGNETASENKQEKKEEKENEKSSDNSNSEHDGKHFVIQRGMCQCNQGFKFPKFKVTSHQKHYWNDQNGKADYLAVTEDDLTFDPPAIPFGNCKLRPTSGGYLPCVYAPAGKWTKTYEKVKILGKSCVTEISELMCATGGKITILKHGQQAEAGKSNATKANTQEQQVYNPVMDYDAFKEEIEEQDQPDAY